MGTDDQLTAQEWKSLWGQSDTEEENEDYVLPKIYPGPKIRCPNCGYWQVGHHSQKASPSRHRAHPQQPGGRLRLPCILLSHDVAGIMLQLQWNYVRVSHPSLFFGGRRIRRQRNVNVIVSGRFPGGAVTTEAQRVVR